MKFVIQRVSKASVSVEKKIVGEIQNGFLVFIGVCDTDTYEIADKMVSKLLNLRIFSDENGKTNLDLKKVNGGLLIISQFTLYADCRKGNRPSFTKAGNPDYANEMYEYILKKCSDEIPHVAHGTFGEHMEVSLINDGPFTVILDSDEICK
ncbi:D-tyrosyl-tRNA(Tyr) deacylase [Parablautia intestinalis]|uniref:D-aminoacyl-tRNA deacylase n=1 Tax=Parablautia intestinalis TaxID=2320100 RepID=A0A3A9AN89_9FIRM|nr:D-aminoacyl-tRNA deacylase [Parablautia intestinalis]MCI8614440.1 D-tyrosyl-tRNA(Tyr) deacylase [Lachnospiraceae bacterium]RKI92759.1 D-tyrosyl-tRNA(Tyr) deacylase [Parablautia intestinalis]